MHQYDVGAQFMMYERWILTVETHEGLGDLAEDERLEMEGELPLAVIL